MPAPALAVMTSAASFAITSGLMEMESPNKRTYERETPTAPLG